MSILYTKNKNIKFTFLVVHISLFITFQLLVFTTVVLQIAYLRFVELDGFAFVVVVTSLFTFVQFLAGQFLDIMAGTVSAWMWLVI